MSAEVTTHGSEDDVSSIPEDQQSRVYMHLNRQFTAVVDDVNGNHDSTISVFGSKSQNAELSHLPVYKQNLATTVQTTRGDHDAWLITKDNTSSLPLGQKAEVDESGSRVIGKFEEILASLRTVALTREEAQSVENILWDVKGELYAAEKRGRVGG